MGLKPALTTRRTVRIVSIHDSCINHEVSDLVEYAKTYDIRHITIIEDKENPPVWFTLKPISKDTRGRIAGECACDDPNRFTNMFLREVARVGVVRIDGHRVKKLDPDGETEKMVPMTQSQRETTAGGPKRLRDLVWNEFDDLIWIEMGLAILAISNLGDEASKNSSAPASTGETDSPSSASNASAAKSDPT